MNEPSVLDQTRITPAKAIQAPEASRHPQHEWDERPASQLSPIVVVQIDRRRLAFPINSDNIFDGKSPAISAAPVLYPNVVHGQISH